MCTHFASIFSLIIFHLHVERVHNARHKNVTSALNTTFLKTSGLYIYFVYGHLGSSTELHKLIICICFKLLKKILVSLFEEMAKKLEFNSKTMILSMTQVSLSPYV